MNSNKQIYSKDVANFLMMMSKNPKQTSFKFKKSSRTHSASSARTCMSASTRPSSSCSSKQSKKPVKQSLTMPEETFITALEPAPRVELEEVKTVKESRAPMITVVSMNKPANNKFAIVDNEETRRK